MPVCSHFLGNLWSIPEASVGPPPGALRFIVTAHVFTGSHLSVKMSIYRITLLFFTIWICHFLLSDYFNWTLIKFSLCRLSSKVFILIAKQKMCTVPVFLKHHFGQASFYCPALSVATCNHWKFPKQLRFVKLVTGCPSAEPWPRWNDVKCFGSCKSCSFPCCQKVINIWGTSFLSLLLRCCEYGCTTCFSYFQCWFRDQGCRTLLSCMITIPSICIQVLGGAAESGAAKWTTLPLLLSPLLPSLFAVLHVLSSQTNPPPQSVEA